ncbi:hypothetical protein SRABI111_00294 [Pseudomonas carnis]|nr:hypothetical protein SRABI111_00294 [Pseudomonas carnis]CAH0137143.1 hypothetical protein SRABI110_00438 [Pseudomonas carnis]CAH0160001.1 hypothetical protein SRABI64_00754 [Pseudomonas carnis]CAH0200124.1 hypothetical protein SRABI08_01872 [Pseudomonas carnis]CAH0293119.1 hypothetical protein SRABI66_04318 [Stenotrophomonas lactitubi]
MASLLHKGHRGSTVALRIPLLVKGSHKPHGHELVLWLGLELL